MGPIYNGKSADKSQIYSVTSPKVEKYIFQINPHFPSGKYVFSNVFNPLSQQYFHLPGHLHPFTHAQLLPPQCCSMRHAWRLRRHHVLVRLHGYCGSLHATIQDETVYDCLVPTFVFSFFLSFSSNTNWYPWRSNISPVIYTVTGLHQDDNLQNCSILT